MKQQWSSTVYILAYIWKSICNITHEENMTLIITVYDLKNLRVVLLIKREKQLIFYGWINCDNKTYVSKCTTYEFSLMFSVLFQYLSNNIVFPLIGFELSSTAWIWIFIYLKTCVNFFALQLLSCLTYTGCQSQMSQRRAANLLSQKHLQSPTIKILVLIWSSAVWPMKGCPRQFQRPWVLDW